VIFSFLVVREGFMDSYNKFIGNWRIIEMEMWEEDFIDAEVQGYINFDKYGRGDFQFGYVHGYMNCSYSNKKGVKTVNFSWEGNDEMDSASGRGNAIIEDEQLSGKLYFDGGDESWFMAINKLG
jgi:hypothetical protein